MSWNVSTDGKIDNIREQIYRYNILFLYNLWYWYKEWLWFVYAGHSRTEFMLLWFFSSMIMCNVLRYKLLYWIKRNRRLYLLLECLLLMRHVGNFWLTALEWGIAQQLQRIIVWIVHLCDDIHWISCYRYFLQRERII